MVSILIQINIFFYLYSFPSYIPSNIAHGIGNNAITKHVVRKGENYYSLIFIISFSSLCHKQIRNSLLDLKLVSGYFLATVTSIAGWQTVCSLGVL